MSNELKAQLNLNECIMRGPDEEVIIIGLCKSNLYKINHTKVHGADAANLMQSWEEDSTRELGHRWLWHLNVKSVHVKNVKM